MADRKKLLLTLVSTVCQVAQNSDGVGAEDMKDDYEESEDSEDSEDSEEDIADEEEVGAMFTHLMELQAQAVGVAAEIEAERREGERENARARVENYVDEVVPKYTPWQFKSHFRMKPHIFEVSHILECVCVCVCSLCKYVSLISVSEMIGNQ